MKQNKNGKYLKYAIGEIVLVVIGILIALQINNWNIDIQNHKQEKEILALLLKEYQNNLNQINQKIDIRNDVLSSSYMMLNYRQDLENPVIKDSIDTHLLRVTLRPTFDPELNVTQELINTGKLYLINNKELRNNISSFSSSLSELKEEEVIIVDYTENQLMPFLRENYQIGRMHMGIFEDQKMREKITMGKMANINSLKNLLIQSDFKPLLKHEDFEDYLAQLISYTAYTNDQSDGVKMKINTILDMIVVELDN
jgi:hypothetical protein